MKGGAKKQQILQLFQDSGIAHTVAESEKLWQDTVQAQSIVPVKKTAIPKAFQAAFLRDEFQKLLLEYFDENFSREELLVLQGDYSSELFKKVVALEKKSPKEMKGDVFKAWLDGLKKKSPEKKRVKLLAELDGSSKSSELVIKSLYSITDALVELQSLNGEKVMDFQQLSFFKKNMALGISREMFLVYLFVYRELSDADLSLYVQKLSEEQHLKFIDAYKEVYLMYIQYVKVKAKKTLLEEKNNQ